MSNNPEPQPRDSRPVYAVVTGHLPPYRVHFQRRIAKEIPELRLATLVTKFRTNQWVNPSDPASNTVMLDPEPPPAGGRKGLAYFHHELGVARSLWAWMDEHRPVAVFCSGYDELPNLYALRWARKHRVPAILGADSNVHGDHAAGLRRVAKRIILRWLMRKYRAVCVQGRVGRQYFHRYGVSDERMFELPYEPDYVLIQNMPEQEIAAARARFGLAAGRRRMVCCARLIAVKRVDLVIAAFQALAAERPEWDLIIVGEGEMRSELERSVRPELRDAGRVKFVGFQDQDTTSAIYRASDVLVLYSDNEPWALVVNEAAAAGLALVTSDRVGASYELLGQGENGFMVPAQSPEVLLAAMRDVTDPVRLEGFKSASVTRLAEWRTRCDPIMGLRKALRFVGALSR
ncbi:MAG: glycosyltransferase family 4 protein [Phycisphaerales bacterium]|nr:glycosyltransferase family 4 protein [Phycisphaerales bacterium]